MSAPKVGISAEGMKHTFMRHNEVCASEGGGEVPCPCGAVVAIVCFACGEPLFVVSIAGGWCEHADELMRP